MIDIFLCPDQDFYFSALEGRLKPVHPENIRICESLLREMHNRASYHRYIVMESYVQMLGGKVKNIEDTIKKLVEVLSAVNFILCSDLNIFLQCSLWLLLSIWQGKM